MDGGKEVESGRPKGDDIVKHPSKLVGDHSLFELQKVHKHIFGGAKHPTTAIVQCDFDLHKALADRREYFLHQVNTEKYSKRIKRVMLALQKSVGKDIHLVDD
mmetsp:Transcript_5158/g.7145  ORF Transcript_5158/g.7145 Transcript_5158/m.7145 type:complete len:103 (-) Transcript_5158:184-492(-)